ncbi:hypothetical protein C5B89_18320 [Haloferax sp. Atlit-47N]|nr:hypothetical protein DEQ67_15085 [Haloferax sp. Atlit-48N]RDZ34371.1 hypothetical protein C5B88_15235 [Haloferax sp. Atlit-24N]RDZ35788.1 hypothetical protein C5B89_18320 [Haloferax sp. Atlit-47N]RLM33693.1 hypothetical protein DVK03_18310 [Haloferax sp. Atlit-109R]RLM40913.1 hypothetical protein DVK04_18020 [Haloferax sp. Atlit-105R]
MVAASPLATAGCSAVTGENESERTTHHHVKSSTVRNGVPSEVKQTVFILDLFEKDGNVEMLVSPQLDLNGYDIPGTKQTTVHLIINDFVDQWQQSWTEQKGLAGILTFESGSDNPVTITAETEFEGGGSIQTSRHEEIRYASGTK